MGKPRPRQSIKRRLLISTVLILTILLFAGGLALSYMFEQHVERRVETELTSHLDQVISAADFLPGGQVSIDKNALAVRFLAPYSGLYWQIDGPEGFTLTSPSLWDTQLNIPKSRGKAFEIVEYEVKGPDGQDLILAYRHVTRKIGGRDFLYRFSVGINHSEVSQAVDEFSKELAIFLVGLAIILGTLVWVQISYGLRPLRRLLPAINAITSGRQRRFTSDHPDEITPLVDELNSLLKQQEIVMERSRARAASLAHGLKTPLAGISLEVQKLEASEQEAAGKIGDLVARMNAQVERELIRSRIRGATYGVRRKNLLAPLAKDIVKTLSRLPRGEELTWDIHIPGELVVVMDTDDLAEILGNLLDNSRKWAKSRVRIEARPAGDVVELEICDDGSAPSETQLRQIQERGMRLDDTIEGTGLGLTIVTDVVAAYGGEFEARVSDLGGLGIRLLLPAV